MSKQYFEVLQCQRVNGSDLGNPNWLLTGRLGDSMELVALKTSSNLSISYGEIPNKVYSKMPEIVTTEIELTKSGRIKDLRVL